MSRVNENRPGYKKTSVGWIPEEWVIDKIGKYATKLGSGSTPRGGHKVYVDDGVPFIRSQNVNNNNLDFEDMAKITQAIHKQMKSTTVKPLDVLLNITGASIGRSCVVPEKLEEGNVNQHVC